MPIIDLQRRLREAGRIRIGETVPTGKGKKRPAKLGTFRFTSADRTALATIATLYGGAVRKWEDAPVGEQWEIVTEATAIPVLLPPVPDALDQFYETWSGGGCVHRCDGEYDMIVGNDCACDPEARECKPHTRLKVILTDLQSIGVWRLDTQGWNAATELAGALEMVALLQGRGQVVAARLLLSERQSRKPGETTKKYVVPGLDIALPAPVTELVAGPAPAAIEAPSSGVTPVPADDAPAPSLEEQFAAVDNPTPRRRTRSSAPPVPPSSLAPRTAQAATEEAPAHELIGQSQSRRMHQLYNQLGLTDRDARLAHATKVIGHELTSSGNLTREEAEKLIGTLEADLAERGE